MYSLKDKVQKKRYLFLFEDMLLITKQEGISKFWLKVQIILRPTVLVELVKNNPNPKARVEFRLYCPKRTFKFFGKDLEHAKMWTEILQKRMNNYFIDNGDQVSSYSDSGDLPSQKELEFFEKRNETDEDSEHSGASYKTSADYDDTEEEVEEEEDVVKEVTENIYDDSPSNQHFNDSNLFDGLFSDDSSSRKPSSTSSRNSSTTSRNSSTTSRGSSSFVSSNISIKKMDPLYDEKEYVKPKKTNNSLLSNSLTDVEEGQSVNLIHDFLSNKPVKTSSENNKKNLSPPSSTGDSSQNTNKNTSSSLTITPQNKPSIVNSNPSFNNNFNNPLTNLNSSSPSISNSQQNLNFFQLQTQQNQIHPSPSVSPLFFQASPSSNLHLHTPPLQQSQPQQSQQDEDDPFLMIAKRKTKSITSVKIISLF